MQKEILLETKLRDSPFTVTLYVERKDPDYGPVYLGWSLQDDGEGRAFGDKVKIPDEKDGEEIAFKLIITQLLESLIGILKK